MRHPALKHADKALRRKRARRWPLWLGADADERMVNAAWLLTSVLFVAVLWIQVCAR